MDFDVPAGMRVTVLKSKPMPPVADPAAAIAEALAKPVNSPRLSQMAKAGDKICIVFTDSTRACPDHLLVPAVLKELESAGVKDQDITLLCGIGLHRPSTLEERIEKLGQAVVDRYRIIDSAPRDPAKLVDLGTTPSGVPLSVNRTAYESDLLIATGIVEPHQYGGYSGGRKTIAVGGAGERMIEYTHGPHMIDHPGTRLGRLEGNPFHEAVTEAAKRAGLRFILNVVQDDDRRILAVRAGAPEAAFEELVAIAKQVFEVPIPHPYDVAVAGVGHPKDTNFYQASRAASYLFFAPTSVVRAGGYIIIPARAEEGAGSGVGEQRYYEAMHNALDMQSILDDARAHGYKPGAQRAFVMAKVQESVKVIVVGSEYPDIARDLKMIPVATFSDAFDIIQKDLGQKLDVVIVPHALLTLPVVQA
jgi:lactate racemase